MILNVDCGGETLSCTLERKRVKNINLRITADGRVKISTL